MMVTSTLKNAPKPARVITGNRSKASSASAPAPSSAVEPNLKAAEKLAIELMAIPGTSGQEAQVAKTIAKKLREAGASAKSIVFDDAFRRTPIKGDTGNLIFTLPGTYKAPRRLLMAHMDTVPLCVGCQPVAKGDLVRSKIETTGLGADDRAGCAVVLTAAIEILKRKLPHPPLTFFWPIQEEIGLHGARHVKISDLGRPQLAFNWDGGPAEKLTVGATGAYRLEIDVHGLASHAGGAPEHGVSAVVIAGLAIADLQRGGWLGDVHKDGKHGTSNIGQIAGGAATNVITDKVSLRAECRSHDPDFRREILARIENAFERAAVETKNVSGVAGRVEIASRLDYEAFMLGEMEPSVLAAEAAVRGTGGTPQRAVTNGGLDANWLSARGTPTVTLGCGQVQVHTVSERLDLVEFRKACRIALRLAAGADHAP